MFGLVAEDRNTQKAIGCVLLLSDHASFYYVKDLVVHPGWQNKKTGTALMKELSRWLERNGADKAMVALITAENLSSFYQQFGYAPAFAMVDHIQRKET